MYSVIIVQCISTYAESIDHDTSKDFAAIQKQISHHLIRLNDIEVDRSHALRIGKGYLRRDLQAVQEVISLIQEGGDWKLYDRRSERWWEHHGTIPRVSIDIRPPQHEIVIKGGPSVNFLHRSDLSLSSSNDDPRRCISCWRYCAGLDNPHVFSCNHVWCLSCIKHLSILSVTNPEFMPPRCCSNGPIALLPIRSELRGIEKWSWERQYAEAIEFNSCNCPVKNCGNSIGPWDCIWLTEKGIQAGPYVVCLKCKALLCSRCVKELTRCSCHQYHRDLLWKT